MCSSVLRFVLQLYPVPKNVLKQYQEILQLLLAAPRHSFSYNMITRLKSLGLDCEAKELICLSTVSRVRFAASCSAVEQARKDIQSVHSDERVVVRCCIRYHPSWYRSSLLYSLFDVITVTMALIPTPPNNAQTLQPKIYQALHKRPLAGDLPTD
eukprot:4904709-Pyramimonas_sp.AAC.1